MLMKNKNAFHAFPLSTAKEGDRLKIAGVINEKHLAKRLISMGLIENTELQLLKSQSIGVVVGCGETRLALGTQMANKIMVLPI